VATPYALAHGLRVLPLKDEWSRRRFAVCMRDEKNLPAAAGLLLEHLAAAGQAEAAGRAEE
jgi:DNA-binding transcriptional LysR family regulator